MADTSADNVGALGTNKFTSRKYVKTETTQEGKMQFKQKSKLR
jgi:hypothetical protein